MKMQNQCDYCGKPATHVIVHHQSTGHSQWYKLPLIPTCKTCTDVAKHVKMLIEEHDFIKKK